MSLLLATALLAAPATLPSCSWDRPGVNPFVGDVVAAVDRYADIPAEVRSRLKARMAKRQYDEIATITRTAISGKARYEGAIRDMHFGAGQVCNTVTRDRWSDQHQERGLVYCESSHCIIVPTVCRNVSRITRLEPRAEAVDALPAAQAVADSAADEDTAVTAGSDETDEALPRLRAGGAFSGFLPSSIGATGTTPGSSNVGGASMPDGIGPRLGAAVGSVVSTVKEAVREAIDLVSSLPLFNASSEGSSLDPVPPTAPTPPTAPVEPSTAGLPGSEPSEFASAPADPATDSAQTAGEDSGAPSGPGPAAAGDPAPAPAGSSGGTSGSASEPGDPGESGGDGDAGNNGNNGNNGGDPVDDLIQDIEQSLEILPVDDLPGGGGPSLLPGGGGEGGGAALPQGGGALPEPTTPLLVLLAGLAAAASARRRRV